MPSHHWKPASALVGTGALLGLLAAPALAESDPTGSATQFFVQERQRATQPAPPRMHVRPTASTLRRIPVQRAIVERRVPRPVATAAAPPSVPAIPVAVYGDRLGQALAAGLQDDAGGAVAVTALTSEDAGLSRADFNDWLQSVRARLQKPNPPAVAIVMLGSNDRQPLADGGVSVDPAMPRWADLYGARVDAVATAFRDAHVPLVWVGLPNVHSEETSADFVRLNGIFRDRSTRDGATYVDSWEAFSDDAGRYSPMGPDVEGQTVKLRKADGFGFTRAGARKLASFVESDIKRLRAPGAKPEAAPQTAAITIEKGRDFDQALEIDVNAQIQREAGLTPDSAVTAARSVAVPAKPAAGPVLPLTVPPQSPDGELARVDGRKPGLQATLEAGAPDAAQTPAPKRGRADDFSWPKP